MKRLIGIILVALAITGCKSEIDNAETVIRNGLIYKYGEPDPFTGLVLNTPAGVPGISALCNSQVEKGRYSGKSECFYNSLRIPRSSGHPFHEHLATDSTVIRPPIPRASGH